MSSHLDFFADFAVTGMVLGVGLGSRPDDWPGVLGSDFHEASWTDHHLVRQFGIVDANFYDGSGEWICDCVNIKPWQLHRFDDMVPEVIGSRYGSFPPRVPFEEVADRLVSAGVEIHHVRRVHMASLEEYWIPDGEVMFWLISDYQLEDFPALRLGDVYAVSTATGVDLRADLLTRYR
ncbi:hypothetical protein C7C45_22630 [Micromonospora arborensis]|uniref:Uncharacterized protein n=1 Tax=Micromonospora arborensis TaxID=2116518 RepID=A0A318NIV4_9ACTN|nr:hypothetical protein [Micromonospora arborensis]PYC67261.1 hypothetical protein C7C45_22630 [Micromonospora arborensis]